LNLFGHLLRTFQQGLRHDVMITAGINEKCHHEKQPGFRLFFLPPDGLAVQPLMLLAPLPSWTLSAADA
jgi:hypothetical protein